MLGFVNIIVNLLFSVLWLEVENQQNARRVTVAGCQNGHIKVAVTDLTGAPSMVLTRFQLHLYLYLFVSLLKGTFTLTFVNLTLNCLK